MSADTIKVVITSKEPFTTIMPVKYEVLLKVSPEFMNEPDKIMSMEQKAEIISQRIKEEFIKLLTF
jgi:hypothetical protein